MISSARCFPRTGNARKPRSFPDRRRSPGARPIAAYAKRDGEELARGHLRRLTGREAPLSVFQSPDVGEAANLDFLRRRTPADDAFLPHEENQIAEAAR